MAKLKFGIFGPLSGKLGAIVGGTWKGIPYLKKAPKINKNAVRSPAQIINETKFGIVNNWLIPFHPFINVGFENLAIRKTAVSAAFSKVYNTVFSGIAPDLIIDPSQMIISSGPLRLLAEVSISFLNINTLQVLWKKNNAKGTRFDDQVTVAMFCPDSKSTCGFIAAVNRSTELHSFLIDEEMIGKPLHGYLFLSSLNRKQISDTIYLGIIENI